MNEAPDALALLGGLEQEGGELRVQRAQLEEGADRRLGVGDEGVAQRDQRVVVRQLAHLVGRLQVGVSGVASTAAAIEDLLRVGEHAPARVQQRREVVEDVGRLLVDAVVGLVARGAGDLLGLLLDLGACEAGRRGA